MAAQSKHEPIRRLVRTHLGQTVIGVIVVTISSFVEVVTIVGAVPVIEILVKPDHLTDPSALSHGIFTGMQGLGIPVNLVSAMAVFLALVVLKNAIAVAANYVLRRTYFKVIESMICDIFSGIFSAKWHFFVANNYGALGNTLIKEMDKFAVALESIVNILSCSLRFVFFVTLAIMIQWELSLMVIVLMGIVLIPFGYLGRLRYRIGEKRLAVSNRYQRSVLDTFNAAKLILGFGNQDRTFQDIKQSIAQFTRTAVQSAMIRFLTPRAFEPVGLLIVLVAVYWGFLNYDLKFAELCALLYALRTGGNLAIEAINHRNEVKSVVPPLDQIYALKAQAERMVQPSGSRPFTRLDNRIDIVDVSFAYPESDVVLSSINLTIPKGGMIALVGGSGAGKTTLVDLLMGFYEPTSGRINIDGRCLSEVEINSWRSRIGYVPQDPFLFHDSIRSNLIWAKEDASDEKLEWACQRANATEFIDDLPDGLDTFVGERGVRLSGGQRQRIALARALLHNPELLILDEATSSLDSESELLIQKSIETIAHDTTIVAIAHRLSTIQKADCIYVLDKGTIVEFGLFADLMGIDAGVFARSAELQGLQPSEPSVMPS